MGADRLVAALLHLQAKGRVTAAALAEELEISERWPSISPFESSGKSGQTDVA